MAGAIHNTKQEKQNPTKFYYHFLFKIFIVAIILIILPFFPSQPPESINQTLLTTAWELLHLLFVGIAISYGLFSRRNHETEKDNTTSKFDNANLVVSRFLQVSSFFEDEAQSPSDSDETKAQTWSAQYHSTKPTVVVAPYRYNKSQSCSSREIQYSNFEHQSAKNSQIGEKPLLLPVRSLKSRVSDESSVSLDSPTSSKRFSRIEEKVKENDVLPSPIPWRSSLLMDQEQESHFVKSRNSRSLESLAKNAEDLVKKKSFHNKKSSPPPPPPPLPPPVFYESISKKQIFRNKKPLSPPPPPIFHKSISKKPSFHNKKFSPPPPPPPPPIFHKSISMKQKSSLFDKEASFDKELKRSFTSEGSDLNWWSGDRVASVNPKVDELEDEESEEEKERRFVDKVIVESDEDTESNEDEDIRGRIVQKDSDESLKAKKSMSSNGDEGVDIDKQADEFIAKFREQIRLQRIESIKRSVRIATKNSSS